MKRMRAGLDHDMSIWEALPILQNGIAASLIAALVCSFLGVYVILKRIVFMTVALSQVSSLGIAVAIMVQMVIGGQFAMSEQTESQTLATVFPIIIAILFACAAAALMANRTAEKKLTRESILGIAYVVPAALALLILDSIGGAVHDINNLLFGNTVFVPSAQLTLLAIVAAIVMVMHGMLYKEFIFVSFDPETATACGMRTLLFNQLLFGSLALMISVSISAIGILPVFAFMVIPPAAALLLTNTLGRAFILATLFGGISALVGFYLSFQFSLPTGPSMIAVASLLFLPGLARNMFARS